MIPKVDFHTHTSYCDGKDTPRQMVEEAYRRAFHALEFQDTVLHLLMMAGV